jgi:uncharacterized protein YicC (UPF0701 family)
MLILWMMVGLLTQQQATAPLKTDQDYAKAMRELSAIDTSLRNNIEEVARADLERVLLFEATMNARDEAARMEEILADVLAFWEARKTKDAIALSRDALAEAANISKALAIIDLHSPSVATLAQERLNKICASCHALHRERLADGAFRIK